MKKIPGLLFTICILIFSNKTIAQDDSWPRTINADDGSVIKIFEPDPDTFSGNTLKSRAAVSLLQPGKTDPVFGTYSAIETDGTATYSRRIYIISVKVPNVEFSS